MREIRTSGSEGGGAGSSTSPSYPYQDQARMPIRLRRISAFLPPASWGYPAEVLHEDILERPLALNLERPAKEASAAN
jgi:hypothetical protein